MITIVLFTLITIFLALIYILRKAGLLSVIQVCLLFLLCVESGLILIFLIINYFPHILGYDWISLLNLDGLNISTKKDIHLNRNVLDQVHEGIQILIKQNKLKADIDSQNLKILNESLKYETEIWGKSLVKTNELLSQVNDKMEEVIKSKKDIIEICERSMNQLTNLLKEEQNIILNQGKQSVEISNKLVEILQEKENPLISRDQSSKKFWKNWP